MSADATPALQALTCPSCASTLRAEDFDAARGWVTCSYCQALMTLPGHSATQPTFRPRAEAPLPPRVTLEKTERGIEIRRRRITLAGGRSSKLAAAGDDPETALYLEQQIERALGLNDRPVAGELAR